MNILILTPDTLRNILCITPALHAVRKQYPDAHITLLTSGIGREICPEGTLIDKHLALEQFSSPGKILRLLSGIRRKKFSLAINFHHESKSAALLTILSGVGMTAGVNSNFLGKFYTHSLARLATEQAHRPYALGLELIEKLGIPPAEALPVIHRSDRDKRNAREYGERHGLYKKATLVLAPTGSSPLHCWSPEHFALIGRKFLAKYGGKVLIIWSGSAIGTAQQVQKLIGERALVSPKTSPGELAALLAEAAVVVCHTSSALHIAYAVRTPTVCLNTPTDYAADTDLQIGIPSLRLHYQAQYPAGAIMDDDIAAQLATIRPERVWEAVEKLWNAHYY
ncbi:MAG: glycosyltransferase family 9 protein [Candidatus Kapaibacterium sp.]